MPIIVVMLVILTLAGLVVVYAAYPHRRARLPGFPRLGRAIEKAADAVPIVDDEPSDQDLSIPLR